LLDDSTPLVREFFLRQFNSDGAASNRGGKPDLYYAIFALAGAQALDAVPPLEATKRWLDSFGEGEGLDFVHLGALARCRAAVSPKQPATDRDFALLRRIESFRQPDGGYDAQPVARSQIDNRQSAIENTPTPTSHGTAYGAFVALGAYQDLGQTPPRPLDLIRSLKLLETPDGAWSNQPGATVGSLNATAGAVTLIRHLGFPVSQDVGDWLLAQAHSQGGFKAAPKAPLPDLLSTATALHALSAMDRRIPSAIHEGCLDFIDTLWSAEGGFHGHWGDDFLDPEYTFYGLLALGHLSL
jgi:hypothetical protein